MFELTELEVTADGDVAYAFALLRCGPPEWYEAEPEKRLRLTLGLRREAAAGASRTSITRGRSRHHR